MSGRRELVFSPYIAVYQVKEHAVEISPHLSRRTGLALKFIMQSEFRPRKAESNGVLRRARQATRRLSLTASFLEKRENWRTRVTSVHRSEKPALYSIKSGPPGHYHKEQ